MESSRRRCPSAPIACHCRSDDGLDRTNPGATQFTRTPNGPSSRAVCRVRPMSPALALAYAWIPVRL